MSRGAGTIQRKILLLLLGGLALGLSGSPRRYFRILKLIGKEWREINRAALWRSIRGLYRSKLVMARRNQDGSVTLVLSENGRERALTYQREAMRIRKPKRWDGKWRLVIFDIPETRKKLRDIFRARLRQLGFLELQKSVFVCPYPCFDEIEFLIEYYEVRPFVRFVVAEFVDIAPHLAQRFGLE